MEKVKLDLSKREEITVRFRKDSQEIKIYPYISMSSQAAMVVEYIKNLENHKNFNSEEGATVDGGVTNSELAQMLFIISEQTNVDIDYENLDEMDAILESGLWGVVVDNLENYYDFRDILNASIELYKLNSDPLRKIVAMLGDIGGLLEGLESVNPKEIEELQASTMGIIKSINEAPVFRDTLIESLNQETPPQEE